MHTENGLIMEIIKAGFVKDKTIELDAESLKTLKISANGSAKMVEVLKYAGSELEGFILKDGCGMGY